MTNSPQLSFKYIFCLPKPCPCSIPFFRINYPKLSKDLYSRTVSWQCYFFFPTRDFGLCRMTKMDTKRNGFYSKERFAYKKKKKTFLFGFEVTSIIEIPFGFSCVYLLTLSETATVTLLKWPHPVQYNAFSIKLCWSIFLLCVYTRWEDSKPSTDSLSNRIRGTHFAFASCKFARRDAKRAPFGIRLTFAAQTFGFQSRQTRPPTRFIELISLSLSFSERFAKGV